MVWAPTIALRAVKGFRSVLKYVPVIGSNQENTPRIACGLKERKEPAKLFKLPALMELLRPTEMIIHGVIDDPDNLPADVRDGLPNGLRKPGFIQQLRFME